jgi:hypothetical protein
MRIVLSLAVCAVATLPAMATPAADALNAVAKCAEISGTPERLQCFDAAAVGAKQVLDDARKQAEAEQKPESDGSLLSWFGLTPEEKPVTKPADFGKNISLAPDPNAPKEITEISSKVVEFAQNAHGKSIFILDNGQVWRQIDGDTTEFYYREKDGPMQVTIATGMLGSFVLKVEGKSGSLKVRRVK